MIRLDRLAGLLGSPDIASALLRDDHGDRQRYTAAITVAVQ